MTPTNTAPAGGRSRRDGKPDRITRETAKTALLVVLVLFALLWIVQIVNNFDSYRLSADYGIEPHHASSLPYIFTAPFLHWSWAHLEGNSIPFLILGFLAALRGTAKFIAVSVLVIATSGLFAWLVSPNAADTVGASGLIFGWLGYVVVRGFFNHHIADIVIGLMVGINYFSFLSLLFPAPHLSYEAHIGGLIGGVAAGWAFRIRTVEHSNGNESVSAATTPAAIPAPHHRRGIEDELSALKSELGQKDSPTEI